MIDPWRPLATLVEPERQPDGSTATVLTVFLAGATCPFRCVFCDLGRHTLAGATPAGALPHQLRQALEHHPGELPAPSHLKLYNASNFFEPRAVPPADLPALAELAAPFEQVVVENHPRLVGRRCFDFAARLAGRLQVAMGLETIHPEALPRLGKQMTLDDFARAARELREHDVGVRTFVLIGAPFVPVDETVAWTVRTAAFAFEQGAEHVSLIPLRSGSFREPTLDEIETAFEQALALGGGVATVDTWELERFASCAGCADKRLARLARMSMSGQAEPRVVCRGHEE